jgi:hypothetical protein
MVPLPVGIVAYVSNCNGIASATIPKHEQTVGAVIEVKIEIVRGECRIWFERERVHPVAPVT